VPTPLPDSTYAVLGLVDKLPRSSGYELVAVARRSLAHCWPISQTLLYRELERLDQLGWVEATRVEQVHAPSKRVYQVSEAGARALTEWLAQAAPTTGTFRSGLILRFFFAYRMDPRHVRELLDGYRRALHAQRDELIALIHKLEAMTTPESRAGRMTALHGLRTAEARLLWADEVEAADGEGNLA
jgi:PadR family transcriptional regulator, regulatory protein AphA